MTVITKDGLIENLNALVSFIATRPEAWRHYCNERRDGKQDIEELSMLIRSLTANQPWRVILSAEKMRTLQDGMNNFFDTMKAFSMVIWEKMDENEKLVSEDA